MKANQARSITKEAKGNMSVAEVFSAIKEAALDGKSKVQWRYELTTEFESRLGALGYTVRDQSNKGKYLYIIEW